MHFPKKIYALFNLQRQKKITAYKSDKNSSGSETTERWEVIKNLFIYAM